MQTRSQTTILLFFALTLLSPIARAQTVPLSFRPVAAEYSTPLDRMVLISANPNQLHIYNPATRTDFPINLSKPPLSLSISPDGMHAAVGHDSLVSYVNIATQALEKTLAAPTSVTTLALGANYVYLPSVGSIQISTGNLNGAVSVPGATLARLHPSGAGLYTVPPTLPAQLADIDVTAGPMGHVSTGPYTGDYAVCGGLWFSPDGRRAYTGCGTVFQSSPSVPGSDEFSWSRVDIRQDGLYWTTLPGDSQIRYLHESPAIGRVALITGPADNQVLLYENAFLEPVGTLQLPGFTVGGNTFVSHGLQVFFNSTGTALYVVMQADPTSGLQNDYALQIFPIGNPPACAPSLGAASANAPAAGVVGSVSITATPTCIYQATSDSPWLQIVSGGYGSGNGTLSYIVRPNGLGSRTGTITVGGQTLLVTQVSSAGSPGLLNPLSFSVGSGADYSKVLDKLVLTAANLNELHIYDPNSGGEQVVALPKLPLSVSVSRDGLAAAVGMDGWVSIVNLSTASITNTFQVFTDVQSILHGSNGFVYTLPQRPVADLFSLEIATSNLNAANATNAGRIPRLSASGNFFYLESSKWDITQGVAKPASPQPNFANVAVCNRFWLSQDGTRMFTGCGTSYTTSDTALADLLPDGSFVQAPAVEWASESSVLHSTAVVPAVGNGVSTVDNVVQVYGDAALGYSGSLSLPSFIVGSAPYAGHGRFTFWNKTNDRLLVVQQADPAAQLVSDYGVTMYLLNTPAAGCTFTLGSTSATLGLPGGTVGVNVTTGAACIWKAASNAPWISVSAGAVAFASSTVTLTVSPNATNVTRVGTVTIAGQTFTVTEAGNPPGLTVTKTHTGPFNVGQTGTYTIAISSVSGAPTSGTITVTDVLPTGLTANAIGGDGWTCTLATFSCTRTSIIAPGSSYPPLTVTVNVAADAPSSLTNTAVVSGGGLPAPLTAIDPTVIQGGSIPTNDLAQGKAATQSSTLPGLASAAASSAVDGNTDGNFSDGSVTTTNLDTSAWWQVDLGSSATVNSIVIWNRTDCCGSRLGDYWVFLSDTPFLATDTPASLQNRPGTFASHQTSAPNPSTTIAPAGARGRYVRVQLSGTDYLSLAEVQVFGSLTSAQSLARTEARGR